MLIRIRQRPTIEATKQWFHYLNIKNEAITFRMLLNCKDYSLSLSVALNQQFKFLK